VKTAASVWGSGTSPLLLTPPMTLSSTENHRGSSGRPEQKSMRHLLPEAGMGAVRGGTASAGGMAGWHGKHGLPGQLCSFKYTRSFKRNSMV
jgi:hypothetical protein